MDFWKSGHEGGDTTSVLAGMQEFVDSPSMSSNSLEYSSDSIVSDQIDTPRVTSTPKAALLAKKRLQAYYSVNKVKAVTVKDEKKESLVEKPPKPIFHRAKKTYPDEAAKAVIRDIEILKRAGYGFAPSGPSPALPSDIIIPTDPIVPISLIQLQGDSPLISTISDMEEENLFKRREIKCRNIRKSDSYRRRSISPRSRNDKHNTDRKDRKVYPSNWEEYKEMGLNPQKDSSLKSKLLRKPRDRKFEFKRYFDLKVPPVPIEIYKCLSKSGESAWVPFPYLRCTATKPQILYSTNQHVTSPGYLTRKQLFTLIPKERILLIEKLTRLSRCEVDYKPITVRKWFPKNWKKSDNSEAKLLENSVGLSFLQSYSDEEEETVEGNNQEAAAAIEENSNFFEDKKEPDFNEFSIPLANENEELTPPGIPNAVPSNLEGNIDKCDLQKAIKSNKSRWDDVSDVTQQSDVSNYHKTPPIEDKEEGEVDSEEEHHVRDENLPVLGAEEYEKTKGELETLEAVLKCSTDYLEDIIMPKEVVEKEKKKVDKRKHTKVLGSKSKMRKSKKKAKKKLEKKDSDTSASSESQEEVDKKKKQKKDTKIRSKNEKKHKERKKGLKKKNLDGSPGNEDVDEESSSNSCLVKGKEKTLLGEKNRKRTVSIDSLSKDRKNSVDMIQEEYEDDIKFFAARFDAESKLKGKTRHKTKTNISLEELTLNPKTDEKIQKRKTNKENSESDGPFSPENLRKKIEQKNKDETVKKTKDKEDILKKNEVKIDLLKMNEEYLREKKRKEERSTSAAKDDGSLSKKDDPPNTENQHTSRRSRSLSIERIKANKKVNKEPGDKSAKVIDLDKSDEERPKSSLESKVKISTKKNKNDFDQVRSQRKRHSSSSGLEKPDKKAKPNPTNDLITEGMEEAVSELISVANIKQEKDSADEKENSKNNSWESDEEVTDYQVVHDKSLDLEIPLNIKAFPRREVKMERDILYLDSLQQKPSVMPPELNQRLLASTLPQSHALHKSDKESEVQTRRYDELEGIEFDPDIPAKKRRWDIQSAESTPLIKLEKFDEIIDLDANSSSNCVTLENEYEEFMKALTSTKDVYSPQISRSVVAESGILLNDERNTDNNKIITNFDELPPKPLPDISTIQIPLPPVVSEQIKPVPVPSPTLEAVIDLNKPLINLSLSANVTQNITLSLATSIPSISAPTTSSIDISKTSVEISTPDTLVSMNNIPLPFNKTSSASDMPEAQLLIPSYSERIASNIPPNTGEFNDQCTNNKLIFTSLTLPSKKKLLGSSKLNLDDSDNDDEALMEELKRKKLEALIADNKRELEVVKLPENPVEAAEVGAKDKSPIHKQSKEISSRNASPPRISDRRIETSPKRSRRELSPPLRHNRDSPVRRREVSPRRRMSPRRRSPRRSPKRRSPVRRAVRRSPSPRRRRSSVSPRRRRSPSPRRKRSPSPRGRQSPYRRLRSPSPRSKRSNTSKDATSQRRSSGRPRSPICQRETSPLKRSVADSTISDDQLLQTEDYSDAKQKETDKEYHSPKRVPLDVRISQVLGYEESTELSPKPVNSTFYHTETVQHNQLYQFGNQYNTIQAQITPPAMRGFNAPRIPQSTYKQVGNMLQIVPTDNLIDIPMPHHLSRMDLSPHVPMTGFQPNIEHNPTPTKPVELRQKILQVGNMLQIVPTDIVPTELIPVPPVHTEIKIEKTEEPWLETPVAMSPEKTSAEASMLLKVAERRAERENRRQEREKRRKEKERRRKEKEKARQAKLKARTENMIKRALELEEEEEEAAVLDTLVDQPVQWPPLPIIVNHSLLKEAGKSILINSSTRHLEESSSDERRSKTVQFADGIRPGEGTSPSAGEDLSSPPPPKKKLPKEKRYKKMKFEKKGGKKKVKVKVIKKPPSPLDESDSDENLPPPSPPPGSPPPHIFPPRIKVNSVNNVPATYLASIIQTAQQQQQPQPQQQQQPAQYQSSMYRPPINLLMAPPPPPQGHLSSVPPHVQSPHGAAGLSPQTHYHPGLTAPPPPPPPPSHSTGHNRLYASR